MKEDEVISLARTGTFHGKVLNGEIEETHISWVVLCRTVVFKIKKPIKLSFLDFSTLSKRRKYCEQEVRLNRRFTDIYQDVVPIRLYNSELVVGENNGKLIEYAVQMRRLATHRRMDDLLKRNQVRDNHIIGLAKTISEAHSRCPIIRKKFVLAEAKRLFSDLRKEVKIIGQHCGKRYADGITECIRASDYFLRSHAARFEERIQAGFKRDVHGDLHSGNIFIYKTPVIFDCIEFNDSFRQIDVLYEVAFLCMDLEKFGKKQLAEIFFREYVRRTRCIQVSEDVAIFNYYKGLRANIRAKVHALGVSQAQNEKERALHLKELKSYLILMHRYLLS